MLVKPGKCCAVADAAVKPDSRTARSGCKANLMIEYLRATISS